MRSAIWRNMSIAARCLTSRSCGVKLEGAMAFVPGDSFKAEVVEERRPPSARAMASSSVSTPARSMPVSTSIITPSCEPAAAAAADSTRGIAHLVDGHEHVAVAGQLREDTDLLRVCDGVDDEEVVEPGPCQGDRLPYRRHRQPDGPGGHLSFRQFDRLVDFDVRSDVGWQSLEGLSHAGDIALCRGKVQQHGRRRARPRHVDRSWRRRCLGPRPFGARAGPVSHANRSSFGLL